jgi:hypothetical protein
MHRPTRQIRQLKLKLERKLAAGRKVGSKTKRWKKWLAQYEAQCEASNQPAEA